MTHPFQSIISTPKSPLRHQDERDERSAFAEALAEDLRAEAATSISPEEPPLGVSELSAVIETGLCNLHETRKDAGSRALRPLPKPLCGGIYTPADALALLNSHFFIGKNNQETGIFRINEDGSATFVPLEQFKLEIQNIFVETVVKTATGNSTKKIPAEKFWKESPYRQQKEIVFKPGGTTKPGEYNIWQDFGVPPHPGSDKMRRLVRHILEIICRRDDAKFDYLIQWLAWAVQNPDKHPETVIVLKSRKQGTGKSTLGNAMLAIFGRHGANIDDKERLLGRFNDWLENQCFILADEILWAGDHRTADKIKSLITAPTIQIERKFGGCHIIQNRLHVIMTTNHDHAIAAGVGDRRFIVYDVSDERACDKAWFDPIYRDLAEGGASEFLHFLQNVNLAGWHPRQILKTLETAEQQRMSGDSVSQWAQACIEADEVIGADVVTHSLGTTVSSEALREAYTGFCRQNGLRPISTDGFGKACSEMFGPRVRLPAQPNSTTGGSNRRPWGYQLPTGTIWQGKLDARLGI